MIARCRRFALLAVAYGLHYSGVLSLWLFLRSKVARRRRICVLGLHRVLSDDDARRTNSQYGILMREGTFARMLEYLNHRFSVISLNALLDGGGNTTEHSRPLGLLTFDDGWRDNYTTAFPWLRRFRMPATVFLVTGLVENQGLFWVERLQRGWANPAGQEHIKASLQTLAAEGAHAMGFDEIVEHLKRMPAETRDRVLNTLLPDGERNDEPNEVDRMMGWDEVKELSSQGIEFGAHTVNHPLLTYESDLTVEHEVRVGRETLENRLGVKTRAFAYPNGDWNDRVRGWVERTGYDCAFTTRAGWYRQGDDLYSIRRIFVHERNVTGWNGTFSPAMFNLTLARWA